MFRGVACKWLEIVAMGVYLACLRPNMLYNLSVHWEERPRGGILGPLGEPRGHKQN